MIDDWEGNLQKSTSAASEKMKNRAIATFGVRGQGAVHYADGNYLRLGYELSFDEVEDSYFLSALNENCARPLRIPIWRSNFCTYEDHLICLNRVSESCIFWSVLPEDPVEYDCLVWKCMKLTPTLENNIRFSILGDAIALSSHRAVRLFSDIGKEIQTYSVSECLSRVTGDEKQTCLAYGNRIRAWERNSKTLNPSFAINIERGMGVEDILYDPPAFYISAMASDRSEKLRLYDIRKLSPNNHDILKYSKTACVWEEERNVLSLSLANNMLLTADDQQVICWHR